MAIKKIFFFFKELQINDDTWKDIGRCECGSQTNARHLQPGTVRNIQKVAYQLKNFLLDVEQWQLKFNLIKFKIP